MVPVVPENRFADSVTLLALPGQDPNFRVNVRFYSLNTDAPVDVNVRAYAMNTRFASMPSIRGRFRRLADDHATEATRT